MQIYVAPSSKLSAHNIVRLSFSKDPRVRRAALKNPGLPAWRMRLNLGVLGLFRTEIGYIAQNPSIKAKLITRIMKRQSTRSWAQPDVYAHPNVSEKELEEAINDTCHSCRAAAVQNPNLPEHLQKQAAIDPSHSLRAVLAGNPGLHPEVLAQLAKDETLGVRRCARANPAYRELDDLALAELFLLYSHEN